MSAIHIRPLEEELRDAIIDGEIMRAEERGEKIGEKRGEKIGEKRGEKIGEKIGEKRGEEKIINKLLKKYDAKEISEMIEIDIEKIEKIKSTKY